MCVCGEGETQQTINHHLDIGNNKVCVGRDLGPGKNTPYFANLLVGGDFGLASNLVNMGTSHELGINLGYSSLILLGFSRLILYFWFYVLCTTY